MQSWHVVEFVSDLYAYGEQAFGRYSVGVAVGEGIGGTLTETVAYSLSPIVPPFREQIETRCCLEVGGEPAMQVVSFLARWGSRRVVVLHDGREYGLTFHPQTGLDDDTASDVAARAAFETFLRTFTFIPITATPPPVTPTVTPASTPVPTETATLAVSRAQPTATTRATVTQGRTSPTPMAQRAATPTAVHPLPPVVEQARADLAGRLGKQVSEVTVQSVEAQTWTNECPEIERQPFGCLPRPPEGYRVIMAVDDDLFE